MLALGPMLGRLLVTLFGALFTFVAKYFVVDKAFRALSIATMAGLIFAVIQIFRSCTGGICSTAIISAAGAYPTFAMGLGIAFNSTTYAIGSTYIIIWAACALYVFKKRMTGMLLGGS